MAIDIKLGTIEADAIKLGSNDVIQVYLNGEALIDTGVPILFSMTVTTPQQQSWLSEGGTLQYEDNGDGTWHVFSYDAITRIYETDTVALNWATKIVINIGDTITNTSYMFFFADYVTEYDLSGLTGELTDVSFMFRQNERLPHIDLSPLNMENALNHEEMLRRCYELVCVSNIDTRNSTNKSLMFDECNSLQYPDATDQADIVDADGANWVNPGACPIVVYMTETQNGYCEFDDGGTCTTPSLITSTITGSYTTVTYNWVVIGATIDGSNTEDYITVTTPAGNTDVTYTVQLTAVIDGVEYYIENDYTQVKTLAPIRITGISQDVAGSCNPNPPLGTDHVLNGKFDTNLDEWSISENTNATVTWDNGTCLFQTGGLYCGIYQTHTLPLGTEVFVSIECDFTVLGSEFIYSDPDNGQSVILVNGLNEWSYTTLQVGGYFAVQRNPVNNGATTLNIDNFSATTYP